MEYSCSDVVLADVSDTVALEPTNPLSAERLVPIELQPLPNTEAIVVATPKTETEILVEHKDWCVPEDVELTLAGKMSLVLLMNQP